MPAGVATSAVTSAPRKPSPGLAERIDTRAGLPVVDPVDLRVRYGKADASAPATRPFTGEPAVGSPRTFSVLRLTGAVLSHDSPPETATIDATLLATSDHAYFYADEAIQADAEEMLESAEDFEEDVWPKITGVFGEPAIPGVDGDPRIIVLQADLGGGVGGYVNGDDGYLSDIFPLSNEAEVIYLDQTLRPGGELFSAVLAHELQHLIHQRNDADEEAWVNEGLSEAALLLAGGVSGGVRRFAGAPETQLNDWPASGTSAHYGAGAAFLRFVADRLGGDAVLGDVAREAADGPAGIDGYVASTVQSPRFHDLFADWIVANVVEDETGPFAYSLDLEAEVQYEIAPGDAKVAEAHQFGTDYYALTDINDGGDYALRFDGGTTVDVFPAGVVAEDGVLWSNKGDGIDTTLTYSVDLTQATDPVLTFSTWYDIEPWYDFGYISVSVDGGTTWEALQGSSMTTDDPVRVALGPGFYGKSGEGDEAGWVDEEIGLGRFAGEEVLVRFEYVTDGATHGAGWAIVDVGLAAAAGSALRPVAAEGWVTVDGALAQDWIVRLILTMDDGTAEVRDLPVSEGGSEVRFSSEGVADAVVAVAGATEGTSNLAPYSLSLDRR